ncbi:MAG: hypothetical protein E7605_03525 [Ruminococcaceae bacterium]|nr:hypothetical protein [Oscillospiraceae bacterium]
MKLTKILSLLLALLMLVSMIACTPETPDTPDDEKPDVDQPGDEKPDDEKPEDKYETITIAQALELCGEVGNITTERYYIRAKIKTIVNAAYGQMIIEDETGEISVYGTYSADGEINYSAMDEKPYKGDEVLLHCILQNYNGTKEVKNARLIEFKKNDAVVDLTAYTTATIAEARAAAVGAKVKVSGVVAAITYANGMKPIGFVLVDNTQSIYVYGGDATQQVAVGNKVELAASKTYWVLGDEQGLADKFGYKGCNQLEDAYLVSNDKKTDNVFDKSWIQESTVKDMLEAPVTEDTTTIIRKVNALVSKRPGNGFTNYYFNDLDGTTGTYTYTQCNGSDFSWLDQFDGKICTVYLMILNAKSTQSGCVYRFLPVAVEDNGYTFDKNGAAEFAVKYHGLTQFLPTYSGNPALEMTTSVSSELLGFENATLSYSSDNESVVKFVPVGDKLIMNCLGAGKATVTVKGAYGGKEYSETFEISVVLNEDVDYVNVAGAIAANKGDTVTVKGIVGPSLVNKTGFYLIDETGVIAVQTDAETMATLQIGHEVILEAVRHINTKGGTNYYGQTCLNDAKVVSNAYGKHEYSTATFVSDKTLKQVYDLNPMTDYTTTVFVLKATVTVEEAQYYTNIYLTDGNGTQLRLYCSNAGQYGWLKAFAGQEVTVEVAACNWNDKNYYTGCVLAVITNEGKICNELNFSK